ncbi:hypothetical protein FRC09_008788 [Ceratobasidium sp. 395]|nr:hypothetical protein FRC09_008788 [Ceratobasidium sp. 395]
MVPRPSDKPTERVQPELREQNLPGQLSGDGNHNPVPTDSDTDSDDDSDGGSDISIHLRPLAPGESLEDHSGPAEDDVAISRGRITYSCVAPSPPPAPPVNQPEAQPPRPTQSRRHVNYPVVAGGARPEDRVLEFIPGGPPGALPNAPNAQ